MTKRYLYKDPKNEIIVGYDCRIPRAEEMAKYTARVYKGLLYEQIEDGKPTLLEDFTHEEKKHKRQAPRGIREKKLATK